MSAGMSIAFALEKQVALSAVRRACGLTASVFNQLVKNETLTKDDRSPVTVADYAAQAVISTILQCAFPEDPIVGEEDASELRGSDNQGLRDKIVSLANEALTEDLGIGENVEWGLGPGKHRTASQLLDAIDKGNYAGGPAGRMWTIDPVDGTKGFLRGEQYAVCVSLIIDAQVKLGVIGCPNLPFDPDLPDGPRGVIFSAVSGQGTEQTTLSSANPTPLSLPSPSSLDDLAFLESVEAAHSSHSTSYLVAKLLGITRSPIRMDSQAKYGCLARGEGGVYFRIPADPLYQEKIWDHAPGSLLVTEAGGLVTDSNGNELNFGVGRTLDANFGVVAASRGAHSKVLEALREVLRNGDRQAKA